MGYAKTTWNDRLVQFARRITMTLVSGTTYDYTVEPGTITEAGTNITAVRMNNIESAIEEVYDGTHVYGSSAVGTDSYAITFATPFLEYVTGMVINLNADVANVGAATLQVDSLTAKNIKKMTSDGKVALTNGDILAGGVYTCIYDGTDFILSTPTAILNSMFTSQGDMIYASAANTPAKLALGTAGRALISNGTNVAYGCPDQVEYIPSDDIIISSDAERSFYWVLYPSGWIPLATIYMKRKGTIKISFDLKGTGANMVAKLTDLVGNDISNSISTNSTTYVTFNLTMNTIMEANTLIYLKVFTYEMNTVYTKNVKMKGIETYYTNQISR